MEDVYVVSATRTAVGRAIRGTLANFRPDEMAAVVVGEAIRRAGITGEQVQDVVLGCAMPEGPQGMNIARIAVHRAGLPYNLTGMTINRFCSSGLEAMQIAAAKIRSGQYDVAIAGGVESMSMVPMGGRGLSPNPHLSVEYPEAYTGMGVCGDNVARELKVTREEADRWALRSNQRAAAAIKAGKFKEEIVPLEVPTGNGSTKIFDTDEGPRADTTLEALAKLKPAFAASAKIGVCTPGNCSQTSDGAAAVCLMSAKAVAETGAKPMARMLGYSVAAGVPNLLGPAQLEAIPKALELSGISLKDVGVIENNEAFATQCVFVVREMKFKEDIVNVNGGAIALGHPLGCTGAKLSVQIIHEMRREGIKYGVVTMCIGGGMGAAGVFELCE